jgi:malate dehydrogenase (oxaloacetate-decarboxylating)
LLAARRERGGLAEDRFLFVGAGAAALGVAGLLRRELEAEGLDPISAGGSIAMLDHLGLVHLERPNLPDDQRPFAVDPRSFIGAGLREADLADPVAVARAIGATVLVGATACAGAFSEALVREVARHDPTPIILPLSNPGSCAEASADDILAWTAGRALVAGGGPSRDVDGPAGRRVIGQANNVFIFPGVGLGTIVAEMPEVDDDVFLVAARELARLVSPDRLRAGALYPPIAQLRAVARAIAIAVVRHARTRGGRSFADEEIEPAVDRAMWSPAYLPYEPAG